MTLAVYVREEIECNETLTTRLNEFAESRGLVAGDTLVVAAQRMAGPPENASWKFHSDANPPNPPSRVIFVVGEYTGGGMLSFAGEDGAGAAGRNIEVYASHVSGLRIVSGGGKGADGKAGSPGQDLTWTKGEWDPESHRWLPAVTPPANGQPGENGHTGGPGGSVQVNWVSGDKPSIAAPGGQGGQGGAGGRGGVGGHSPLGYIGSNRWKTWPDMQAGAHGAVGAVGPAGRTGSYQLEPDLLWARARNALGPVAAELASHWERAASYWFRQVAGSPTETELTRILALLDLSLRVVPGDADATRTRQYLLTGCNALGLPRNLDIVPDFEHYNDRLQIKLQHVGDLFSFVENLLTDMTTAALTTATLDAHRQHLADYQDILATELRLADEARGEAEANLTYATKQWEAINAEVARRQEALKEARVNWGGLFFLGLATLVGVIVSVASEGAAAPWVKVGLAQLPGILGIADVSFTGSEKEEKLLANAVAAGSKVVKDAKGAKDLAAQQNAQGEIDVPELVNQSGVLLIDLIKIGKELDAADGDPQLKALVKEQAERLHQKVLAEQQLAQAKRNILILQARQAAAAQDAARYTSLFGQAQQDAAKLKDTVLAALANAQPYADSLLVNQFKAARALEIYTLTDTSDRQRLGYGQVHPDAVADLRDGFMAPAQFRDKILQSKTTELDLLKMDQEFDTFMEQNWQRAWYYRVVDSAAELERFRASRSLTVNVSLDDLATSEYAARAVGVSVYLSGVTLRTPSFEVELTHHGRCQQRLEGPDGAAIAVDQPLQAKRQNVDVVPPTPQGDWLIGLLNADADLKRPRGFWGRGIATTWTLFIDPEEIADNGVDLTNVQSVTIGIRYDMLKRG